MIELVSEDVEKQVQALTAGTAAVLPAGLLAQAISKNDVLRIKIGVDPTAPDLHLGHAVVLSKVRQFQSYGHEVHFIIGDFTAAIGDPTGRSKVRPSLNEDDIKHNMQTYFDQVGQLLDMSNAIVHYNSTWLGSLSSAAMVKLFSRMTVAQLIEREDFAKRLKEHQPVAMHELMYPIFQAYDSVVVKADVEIGGTDQTFNLLLGRELQHSYGMPEQIVVTTPLLEGLDGVYKMSKSLENAIGLNEPADQAFGKLMSISDSLMWRYMQLLLRVDDQEISVLQERVAFESLHPKAIKKQMAYDIVSNFWSKEKADLARRQFEQLFEQKNLQAATETIVPYIDKQPIWVVNLLKELGAVASSSDARRLIQAGAVSIDGQKIDDFKAEIVIVSGMVLKVGKHRIFKLICSV